MDEWWSFDSLLTHFRNAARNFKDVRTGKNIQFSMEDAALGAFSVFFTQSPSFLSHQQYLQETEGNNNAKTIFGVGQIPSDNQIRNLLDPVEPDSLSGCYTEILSALRDHHVLDDFKMNDLGNSTLVALDGVQYFSSTTIHNERSLVKNSSKTGTSYHQSCLLPAIVSPNKNIVLPLFPEFITPQDGDQKQDCEYKAGIRWLDRSHPELDGQNVTLLGDDLYARQGICEAVLKNGWDFIFTCKPLSHKYLFETIKGLELTKDLKSYTSSFWEKGHKITEEYRWALNIPVREKDPLEANWIEVRITNETGKVLYQSTFLTSHFIDEGSAAAIVKAGRARWKIENEGNNTLKNHGYNLEHNFGHGKKALAQTLLAMNILAFLFHSVLELKDAAYREVRGLLGRRQKFFQHLEALTTYIIYKNFDYLIEFMLGKLREVASRKTPKTSRKKSS